jgi:hypothetical protein
MHLHNTGIVKTLAAAGQTAEADEQAIWTFEFIHVLLKSRTRLHEQHAYIVKS